MKAISSRIAYVPLLFIAFFAPVHKAVAQNKPVLIEAATLKAEITRHVIIDVRKEKEYIKGHIPGALQVWRPDLENKDYPYGGMMASKTEMEALLSKLGVDATDHLVVYDDNGDVDASRLRWILEVYGFNSVSLLNGGLNAWKTAGYELSAEYPKINPSSFHFELPENREHYAGIGEVKQALNDPSAVILDVRSINEYSGAEQKEGSFRRGHIPNSIFFEWSDALSDDQSFKPEAEIRSMLDSLGITPDKKIIVYCHSGVRSAHTTFVLQHLLGFPNVKNYDGSWIEWSYHDSLPVQTAPLVAAFAGMSYTDIFINGYSGYANYLRNEILYPGWHNYFYWLLAVSLFFFTLEWLRPWRKEQARFRQDFWLDFFYMFFNFFLFSLIIYNAASDVVVQFFNSNLASVGIHNLLAFEVQTWPLWSHLLIGFIVRDFVQWLIHRLLHRVPALWEFHKVHHSVKEMGFAAHLRYHWMENVVYRTLEYIPLALIGIGLNDFFIIHIATLAIGHWNHSNFYLNIGFLKYIFNNPAMHIWHHAYELPENKKHGVNFGLSLSLWDYLFGTAYIPADGRDIKLGFPGVEKFPSKFVSQAFYGFRQKK